MRIGTVGGISRILANESHFWLHRKENQPIIGKSRTAPGREVNVFSMMSPLILVGFRLARSMATAPPKDWPYRMMCFETCSSTNKYSSAACASRWRPCEHQPRAIVTINNM